MCDHGQDAVHTGIWSKDDTHPTQTQDSRCAKGLPSQTSYQASEEKCRPVSQFTTGRMRVVTAHDGEKDCLAILLDEQMLGLMQDLAKIQTTVSDNELAVGKARMKVNLIEKYGQQHQALEEMKQEARDIDRRRKEIEDGIPELLEAQQQWETLQKQVSRPRSDLERIRNILQRTILQGLREANLLTLPIIKPSPGPPQAIHSNYSICSSSCVTPPPNFSHPNGANTANSKEETTRHNAITKLNRTREGLMEAQYQLDRQRQEYDEDLASHRFKVSEGVWSLTTTEFDLGYLQIGQDLTRDLIEAEEAYDKAIEEVKAADASSDAESSYYGDYFEPSLVGIECEVLEKSVRPRVEKWQAGLIDSGKPENCEPPNLDQWDAKPIDVSDSVSAVAFDPYYRKHINRWKISQITARDEHGLRHEQEPDEDGRGQKRRRSW